MAPTSTSVDGLETVETRNYKISRAPQARHRCAGSRANRRQLRWTVAPRKHSRAKTRSVERLLRLARTSRAHGSWLVQPAEPPDADPHVRSCGRGGRVTVSPIPINRHMRRVLNQAANAGVKVKGSIFEIAYRRSVPRLGHNQAIGAIAHRQCRLIWLILHQGVRYEERGPAVNNQSKQRRTKRMIRQLRQLGYRIESPNPQPSQAQTQ